MSLCGICGSRLDYDDYCNRDNSHAKIRSLESLLVEAKLEIESLKLRRLNYEDLRFCMIDAADNLIKCRTEISRLHEILNKQINPE